MSRPHIIKVNESCIDAEGNDYNLRAYPHVIEAGLMIERPVLLQYPDGRLKEGVEVMLTTKGLAAAKAGLDADRAGHKPGNA
jgi:hypothetical protein